MGVLYTVAAFAGLGWAVVSFLLGQLGGDAGGGDAGGAHAAGHAGGHDHDADHEGLPLLSPTVLAGAAAGFGFTGLGLRAADTPALLHLPLAAGAGAGLALLLALFLAKAVRGMEATTSVTAADVEGLEAEVIVPIPAGGLGEIAFEAGGGRMAAPARDRAGAARPRGARVLVTRVRPDGIHEVEGIEPARAGGTTRITEG